MLAYRLASVPSFSANYSMTTLMNAGSREATDANQQGKDGLGSGGREAIIQMQNNGVLAEIATTHRI